MEGKLREQDIEASGPTRLEVRGDQETHSALQFPFCMHTVQEPSQRMAPPTIDSCPLPN